MGLTIHGGALWRSGGKLIVTRPSVSTSRPKSQTKQQESLLTICHRLIRDVSKSSTWMPSRYHVMLGGGIPSAWQTSTAESPLLTSTVLWGTYMIGSSTYRHTRTSNRPTRSSTYCRQGHSKYVEPPRRHSSFPRKAFREWLHVDPLTRTLKPHSNGPLYSNMVIATLAVDGRGVLRLVQWGKAWVPSSLLAVPNVTAYPWTASVPTSYYTMWHFASEF